MTETKKTRSVLQKPQRTDYFMIFREKKAVKPLLNAVKAWNILHKHRRTRV